MSPDMENSMTVMVPKRGSLSWWKLILDNREDRMAVLLEVKAPAHIITNEKKLIAQAQEEVQKKMN